MTRCINTGFVKVCLLFWTTSLAKLFGWGVGDSGLCAVWRCTCAIRLFVCFQEYKPERFEHFANISAAYHLPFSIGPRYSKPQHTFKAILTFAFLSSLVPPRYGRASASQSKGRRLGLGSGESPLCARNASPTSKRRTSVLQTCCAHIYKTS